MRSKKISKMNGLLACALACAFLSAEVTIREVKTMTYGDKASIVIKYEGAEKLQFFAINPAEGVLTLDFPGVISLYDFDQLDVELVEQVRQVPLDPDSHRGVSVHFTFRPGVQYDLYDSDPGQLVLFLEQGGDHTDMVIATPMETESQGASTEMAAVEPQSLRGVEGLQKLHQVTVTGDDQSGFVDVYVSGDVALSDFRLDNPPRYALNLKGVSSSLLEGDLNVSSQLVEGVRVRQFQVHPEPIARMVLDLAVEGVNIQFEATEYGARVWYASQPGDIGRMPTLAVDANVSNGNETVEEAPTMVIEVAEIVAEEPEAMDLPAETTVGEESVAANSDGPMETYEVPVETVEIAATPEIAAASMEPEEVTPKPAFDLASDIDQELAEFGSSDSFYDQMKTVKRTHGSVKPIEITDRAIADSMSLGEARSMQEDFAEPQQQSLFDEVESMQDDSYERIDGGQGKYRGFEIQKIDVKDANVVDLLRFLADQVGINLYVDPSVQKLKATYSFRNIPWDQAMDIILRNANLDWEFENGVLRVATTAKFKDEAEQRRALLLERELSVPPETVTFPLSYAKVKEVVPIIEQYLSPRGTILFDERTNTLIIEDIPKRMVAIRTLIRRLDTRVPQVAIEARIVETTKRFIRELGIQWGLDAEYSPESGTDTGVTFPNRIGVGGPNFGRNSPGGLAGGYAVNFPVISESPSGIGLSFGNFLNTFQLDISLQMLESEGNGQIISAPKVITQNNKTAVIKNGQRIPTQTEQRGTITVRYIDAVLELEVTPQVTNEKTIIMDLVVDKSEADFTRTVLGNPVINVRRAETRVLVKDGGTAVIGGIFVLSEQDSSVGIPGLRRIPIVKHLFGSDNKQLQNQELLIFITPRIVKY
ncbi:MAG: type IV pilus secretin PilQ [Acidobacteria bacterium]|nr:type IV pilus secretin PilQ [Acidobacteriota bacterium]